MSEQEIKDTELIDNFMGINKHVKGKIGYYISQDLLIPVWQKIKSLELPEINKRSNFIYYKNCIQYYIFKQDNPNIYKSILDFITWYNQNKAK